MNEIRSGRLYDVAVDEDGLQPKVRDMDGRLRQAFARGEGAQLVACGGRVDDDAAGVSQGVGDPGVMFGAVAGTAEFRMGDRNQVVEQNNSFHTRRLQLNQGRRLVQRGVAHVEIEIGGRRRDDMARAEKLFEHPASVRRLLERRRGRRADHRQVRANRCGQRGQQPRLVRRIARRIGSPIPPRP